MPSDIANDMSTLWKDTLPASIQETWGTNQTDAPERLSSVPFWDDVMPLVFVGGDSGAHVKQDVEGNEFCILPTGLKYNLWLKSTPTTAWNAPSFFCENDDMRSIHPSQDFASANEHSLVVYNSSSHKPTSKWHQMLWKCFDGRNQVDPVLALVLLCFLLFRAITILRTMTTFDNHHVENLGYCKLFEPESSVDQNRKGNRKVAASAASASGTPKRSHPKGSSVAPSGLASLVMEDTEQHQTILNESLYGPFAPPNLSRGPSLDVQGRPPMPSTPRPDETLNSAPLAVAGRMRGSLRSPVSDTVGLHPYSWRQNRQDNPSLMQKIWGAVLMQACVEPRQQETLHHKNHHNSSNDGMDWSPATVEQLVKTCIQRELPILQMNWQHSQAQEITKAVRQVFEDHAEKRRYRARQRRSSGAEDDDDYQEVDRAHNPPEANGAIDKTGVTGD